MASSPDTETDREIRTTPCPRCPICGSAGRPFYQGLEDVFFGTPGKWDSRKCENPGCRLVWLDPMPVEEDIHLAYRNYFTHEGTSAARWIEAAESSRSLYRRFYLAVRGGYWQNRYGYSRETVGGRGALGWLAWLHPPWRASFDAGAMFLKARPGGRLLEIGSGGGKQLTIMRSLGWDVRGVDRDPDARRNAESRGLTVDAGVLEDQGYPDGTFDAVISNHVIEHVFDPLGLMKEIYRTLKPGGHMVFITPNIESLGQRLYRNADVMFMDSPRHLFVFTMPSLRLLAEKAGFDEVKATTSLRNAAAHYFGDLAISRTGRFDAREAPGPGDRLKAKGVQVMEWATLKFRPTAGEEVILIAQKKP